MLFLKFYCGKTTFGLTIKDIQMKGMKFTLNFMGKPKKGEKG
jgi:hypothetical protein